MSIDTDIERLGLGAGGLIRGFFGWLADAPTRPEQPEPPKTEYEQLQINADERYKDQEADRKMYDVTTDYLMQDKERNLEDEELREVLAGESKNYSYSNPDRVRNNYPIEEVQLNWDKIKPQYQRSKESYTGQISYWEKRQKRLDEQSDKWFQEYITLERDVSTEQDADKRHAFHMYQYYSNDAWDMYKKIKGYKEQIKDLKRNPLSDRDLNIYVNRIEDPVEKEYALALMQYNKQLVIDRANRKAEPHTVFPEPYGSSYKDPRLSSVASGNTPGELQNIVASIDRINLSQEMPDEENRIRGYKPSYDPALKQLIMEEDINIVRHSNTYGRESSLEMYENWLQRAIEGVADAEEKGYDNLKDHYENEIIEYTQKIKEIKEEPLYFGGFTEDQMFSLLGVPGLSGVFQNDPDRIEWDDAQTKTHELLHRYMHISGFTKQEFKEEDNFTKTSDSEMFVRAYTAVLRGESLDDEFFERLKETAEGGSYYNIVETGEGDDYTLDYENTDIDKFRKDLPAMIRRFEQHVLTTEPESDEEIREINYIPPAPEPIYSPVTDPAPPSNAPITSTPKPSLLSRGIEKFKEALPTDSEIAFGIGKGIENIKGMVPLQYRTYIHKVIMQNKDDFTTEDMSSEELKVYNEQIMEEIRENIDSGRWFINDIGELQSLTNQDNLAGKKSKAEGFRPSFPWQNNSLYETFGKSSFKIHRDNQDVSLVDWYDFNFHHIYTGPQTKPGLNIENIKEYDKLMWEASILHGRSKQSSIGEKGYYDAIRAMGMAERYAAFNLPDKKTASDLEIEYDPIILDVNTTLGFEQEEWDSLMMQAEINGLMENRKRYLENLGPDGTVSGGLIFHPSESTTLGPLEEPK